MFATHGIYLAHLRTFLPTLQQSFTTSGAYTFNIPYWCRKIDVVLIGGGGGGSTATNFNAGDGGHCGIWNTVTVIRGVDFAWSVTSITGTVGAAGAAGSGSGGAPGGAGGNTTATATGWGGLTASGGASISGSGGITQGTAAGNEVFDGQTYVGGAQSAANNPGNPPGGGGSGAAAFGTTGNIGSAGAAYFYIYQ